jgi:hypothetical protein
MRVLGVSLHDRTEEMRKVRRGREAAAFRDFARTGSALSDSVLAHY